MAKKYAIRDLVEPCDYLRDPILRACYADMLLPSATTDSN